MSLLFGRLAGPIGPHGTLVAEDERGKIQKSETVGPRRVTFGPIRTQQNEKKQRWRVFRRRSQRRHNKPAKVTHSTTPRLGGVLDSKRPSPIVYYLPHQRAPTQLS